MAEFNSFGIITYTELQGCCLAVLLILYSAVIFHQRRDSLLLIKYTFRLLNTYVVLISVDLIRALFTWYNPEMILPQYILDILWLLSVLAGTAFWYLFCTEESTHEILKNRFIIFIALLPIIVLAAFVVTSPWTGLVFSIDAKGVYSRGILNMPLFHINIAYLFLGAVRSFSRSLRAKKSNDNTSKGRELLMAVFPLPIILSIVMQGFIGAGAISVGCTCAMAILYINYVKRLSLKKAFDEQAALEKEKQQAVERAISRVKIAQEEARKEAQKIVNGLSNDFALILVVNPADDSESIYRVEKKYTDELEGWDDCHDFNERMRLFMHQFVHRDDREHFRFATHKDVILTNLEKSPAYLVDFRHDNHGRVEYWQVKFTIGSTDPVKLVAGFHNIDGDYRARQEREKLAEDSAKQATFAKLFVDAYLAAFYIDIRTGEYVSYKTDEKFDSKYESISDYETAITEFINNEVYEDDRPLMFKQTRLSYIKDKLKTSEGFSLIFRDIKKGYPSYTQMRVLRGFDDNYFGQAFIDVNDEYATEKDHQEKLALLVSERTSELEEKNRALNRMRDDIIDIMADIVENRDSDSGEHIQRVKGFTFILGKRVMKDLPEYGLTDRRIRLMTLAASLHDVGKIAIPDAILLKPGKLTFEEFEIMKAHTLRGADIIEKMKGTWNKEMLKMAVNIAKSHHEKWDGHGYPEGLVGDAIPIEAQIVSIADIFDALTTKRCYKDAYDYDAAVSMIMNGECGAFSDKLLACFAGCKDEFVRNAMNPSEFSEMDYDTQTGRSRYRRHYEVAGLSGSLKNAAAETMANMKQMISSLPGGFFVYRLNDDEELMECNEALIEMFGCKTERELREYVDDSFGKMVHPDDIDDVHLKISSHNVVLGKLNHIRFRIVRKDGEERYIEAFCRMVEDEKLGRLQYVFTEDITDTVSAQDVEAQIRNARIIESQKKTIENQQLLVDEADRAKSAFLFNMSHDVRTPMNAILGFTELAQTHIDERETVKEYLGNVAKAGNRLLRLINEVLDMSRVETGQANIELEKVDITESIDAIMSVCHPLAKDKGVDLEYVNKNVKDVMVMADDMHVSQALLKVLVNAINYTKSGGKVTFSIEQTQSERTGYAKYIIVIEDTGIGMSKEFLEHVFEPFSREDNVTVNKIEGLGLGMTIVNRLVDAMGGTIRIDSQKKVGTKVTISFEFILADRESLSGGSGLITDRQEVAIEGKRVLIVDDMELNRLIIREILHDAGVITEEAENGREAIFMLNEDVNRCDMVFMDIMMPVMDGYEATRRIRKIKGAENLPIVAVSANAFEEDFKASIEAGMNTHISKPINALKVISILKEYVR